MSKQTLTISIAMATYNGERYLREQLDSLAAQTYPPAELVVTDDGSKDATLEILEQFAASAPFPVRVFRNEKNLGYGSNFMRAASLCTGDLISFADQDDKWYPEKLASCVRTFQDEQVILCVHSAEMWDGGESITGRCPDYRSSKAYAPDRLYPLQSSYGFAMVFRRALLEVADNQQRLAIVPGEPLMAHDQWIWFLGTVFGKVALISSALVRYRQHGANLFGGVGSNLGQDAKSAVAVRDYEGRGVREARCAEFLEGIAARGGTWSAKATQGAKYLRRCARVSQLRAAIYRQGASLSRRFGAFLHMCVSGAYLSATVRSGRAGQLGPRSPFRAALKDLALGVGRSH